MIFADIAVVPPYKLICTVDPNTARADGQTVDSTQIKSMTFSLDMANGGKPLSINPKQLVNEDTFFQPLINQPPRLKGELVTYSIAYTMPMIKPQTDSIVEGINSFASINVTGLLLVHLAHLRFELEQTVRVHLNTNLPINDRKDLNLSIKGSCTRHKIVSHFRR